MFNIIISGFVRYFFHYIGYYIQVTTSQLIISEKNKCILVVSITSTDKRQNTFLQEYLFKNSSLSQLLLFLIISKFS